MRTRSKSKAESVAKQVEKFESKEGSLPSNKVVKSETDAYYRIDKHDLFNLVALIPLNGINMMHIKMCWFSEARAMDLFWVFYSVTVLYFVVDLAWIYIKPQSVKSPKFIMGHHVVTMSYLLIPYNYPHLAWCMSLCKILCLYSPRYYITILIVAFQTQACP